MFEVDVKQPLYADRAFYANANLCNVTCNGPLVVEPYNCKLLAEEYCSGITKTPSSPHHCTIHAQQPDLFSLFT